MSKKENEFAEKLDSLKIPYKRQYKFHPTRRFLADFWIVGTKILIEIEGATYKRTRSKKRPNEIYIGGRHNTGEGYENDCEKYNLAANLGFTLYRIPTSWMKKKENPRYAWVIEQLSKS